MKGFTRLLGTALVFLTLQFPVGLHAAAPTVNASNVVITSITPVGSDLVVSLAWTSGNGANRLVVARANSSSATPVTLVPTNGLAPFVSSTLLAVNTDQGVFNGNGNTATVTIPGLVAIVTQNLYVTIYEYNGAGLGIEYLTTGTPVLAAFLGNALTIPAGTYDGLFFVNPAPTTVTIGGNITISGQLGLSQTVLNAGANTVTVSSGDIAIAPAGTGFIFGRLQMPAAAAGSSRTWHVSNGTALTDYRPVTLRTNSGSGNITARIGAIANITAETGAPDITANTGKWNKYADLILSGGSLNADVTLSYTYTAADFSVLGAESTMDVYHFTGGNWIKETKGVQVTGGSPSTVTATNVSSFSPFTMSTTTELPLPVELSAFNGSATAEGVSLSWKTASEQDNAGFSILRGGNVIASYQTASALAGQGTATTEKTYGFMDGAVDAGQTYTYSLRSHDLNGTTHDYPAGVTVKVESGVTGKAAAYRLEQNYPNPFNPATLIRFQLPTVAGATLKIYDVLGREVADLSRQIQASTAEQRVRWNADAVTSGVYYYRLSTPAFSRTMKMTVVK